VHKVDVTCPRLCFFLCFFVCLLVRLPAGLVGKISWISGRDTPCGKKQPISFFFWGDTDMHYRKKQLYSSRHKLQTTILKPLQLYWQLTIANHDRPTHNSVDRGSSSVRSLGVTVTLHAIQILSRGDCPDVRPRITESQLPVLTCFESPTADWRVLYGRFFMWGTKHCAVSATAELLIHASHTRTQVEPQPRTLPYNYKQLV